MNETSRAEAWLQASLKRLSDDRFRVSHDASSNGQRFTAVAHRSRFELSKFGNCETLFVFGRPSGADATGLRQFCSQAFEYALQHKRFPLPRGVFEAVFCFGVGLVDRLDPAVAEQIRSTAPPKHWASGEIPVVYDQSNGSLCYFEKTPAWGAAYFKGFRNQIKKYLVA